MPDDSEHKPRRRRRTTLTEAQHWAIDAEIYANAADADAARELLDALLAEPGRKDLLEQLRGTALLGDIADRLVGINSSSPAHPGGLDEVGGPKILVYSARRKTRTMMLVELEREARKWAKGAPVLTQDKFIEHLRGWVSARPELWLPPAKGTMHNWLSTFWSRVKK